MDDLSNNAYLDTGPKPRGRNRPVELLDLPNTSAPVLVVVPVGLTAYRESWDWHDVIVPPPVVR